MAVLIWLMIIPLLVKIDFAALSRVKDHWRGIGVTLFINWAVKPFSMTFLGLLFIGWLFKPYLPADQINSYMLSEVKIVNSTHGWYEAGATIASEKAGG